MLLSLIFFVFSLVVFFFSTFVWHSFWLSLLCVVVLIVSLFGIVASTNEDRDEIDYLHTSMRSLKHEVYELKNNTSRPER